MQIWGGLFGNPDAGWLSAPADLLWEGARLYVAGRPDPADPSIWLADRIRIVGAPVSVRATLRTFEPLANSVNDGDFLALLGNSGRAGVYLLTRTGLAQPLWGAERQATWLGPTADGGMLVATDDLATGPNGFTWVRTDGTAIQIAAQPFQRIRGIVGDEHSGIWWLETPQARLDQWQLWHYEPQTRRIALRLQTTATAFANGASGESPAPTLLAVRPIWNGDQLQSVILIVDTLDGRSQQPYRGLYRWELQLAENGVGNLQGNPELLLAPDSYRGPLRVSPDNNQLAYLVYDETVASLTVADRRPPNSLRRLALWAPIETLAQDGSGTQTLYAVANSTEFLAPMVQWLGNDRLQAVRSRFAPGSTSTLEPFAVLDIRLSSDHLPTERETDTEGTTRFVSSNSYLLRTGYFLRDATVCRNDQSFLLIEESGAGGLELVRWDGQSAAVPLFGLPSDLNRTLLCWQAN
ncbi:MAG: hypothetical protein R2932_47120 [Caldilineaceae bacterium]